METLFCWVVNESLSDSINIGKSVIDFTKSDELAEYTNVELIVDEETSVRAQAVGSLFGEPNTWGVFHSHSGDSVTVESSGFVLTSENGNTGWSLSVYSNSLVKYNELWDGRTVHVSMTVTGLSGSGWEVIAGVYSHKTNSGYDAERLTYKDIGSIPSGEFTFDFAVGDWYKSEYISAYIGLYIYLHSDNPASVRISNIKMYTDDDSATTLTANCTFATVDMAQRILRALSGFRYRPYEAKGARLDPSIEIGDNVIIDDYGYGLYSQDARFGAEFVADISAPNDEEIDHEFPYVPATERKFTREMRTLRAEIDIRSGEIEAKVEEMVPSEYGNQQTFGWKLQRDNFSVYSNGQTVLRVTQSGAEISGRVTATSGTIGGCVIENGRLNINNAKITTLDASVINVGVLNANQIPVLNSSKLGENSVTNYQLGTDSVRGYNIYGGAVSYGKTDSWLQGQVTQIGTNMSNIAAINKKFVTALSVVGLEVTGGGIIVKYRGENKTFTPRAKNDSAMKLVLGAT